MPVFHVFSPSIRRAARVSMCVASDPCSGSVMPKAKPVVPSRRGPTNSAFCSSVVPLLEGHELGLDERIHLGEERGDVRLDVEVHAGAIPPSPRHVK
jgi:hypothetical protein